MSRFEEAYGGTPPWDVGRPQPDVAALVDDADLQGRLLDLGCGTGENALYAARRGGSVVGVDLVPVAVRRAREKAATGATPAEWAAATALALPFRSGAFDHVLDSGVFHVFPDEERARYAAEVTRVTRPGGSYHVLVFSEEEPGDWGPRRVTRPELRAAFADGWVEEVLEEAHYLNHLNPTGSAAWLGSFRRQG